MGTPIYFDISLSGTGVGDGSPTNPYTWDDALDEYNQYSWIGYNANVGHGDTDFYIRGTRHLVSGGLIIAQSCAANVRLLPWDLSLYGPWRIGIDDPSSTITVFGYDTSGYVLDGAILKAGGVTFDGSVYSINVYRTTIIATNIFLIQNPHANSGYDFSYYYGCSFIATNSITFQSVLPPYGNTYVDCIFEFATASATKSTTNFVNCTMPSTVNIDIGQSVVPSGFATAIDLYVSGVHGSFYTADGSDTTNHDLANIKGGSLIQNDNFVFNMWAHFAGDGLTATGYSLANFITHYGINDGDLFSIDGTDTTGGDFLTAKGSALADDDLFQWSSGTVTYIPLSYYILTYTGLAVNYTDCQTNWTPTTFPSWDDAVQSDWGQVILAVGISTPPEQGAGYPSYAGYATGLFGEARTGIGALYFNGFPPPPPPVGGAQEDINVVMIS